MLSRSDPFIYLGPGCPTLYYPKPSADQTGPSQPLPSFIVPRRSVQPHAFILPTVGRDRQVLQQQQSSQDVSHLPLGTSKKKKNPRGQVGKRRTGPVQNIRHGSRNFEQPAGSIQIMPSRMQQPFLTQPTEVKNSSAQTDWLLDTRESFVFVEANQMVSEGVLAGGDCGVGAGAYHQVLPFSNHLNNNKGESNFEATSVLSTSVLQENSGHLFDLSLGLGNSDIYNNVATEGYSEDQKGNLYEILNKNSETESDEGETVYNEDAYVLGDAETSYAQNVFMSNAPLETEEFDDGGFYEVNICDSLEAGYIVSDNTLGYLDREKVFDMEEDEASFSDTNLARHGAGELLTMNVGIDDSNRDVKEVVVTGSESIKTVIDTSESQAKVIVSQIIDSLLENVTQLSLDSNLFNQNSGEEFKSDLTMNSHIGGFRVSPKDILGSEETIENIEEFIDVNNIKTTQLNSENLFSQFSAPVSPICPSYSQLMGPDIVTGSTPCYGLIKIAGSSVHDDPTVKNNIQGMMSYSNSGVEDLPVMLCPVTGLVYSEGDVPSGE